MIRDSARDILDWYDILVTAGNGKEAEEENKQKYESETEKTRMTRRRVLTRSLIVTVFFGFRTYILIMTIFRSCALLDI